jgi:hypothetical protein
MNAAEMLEDFIGRSLQTKLDTTQREHALGLLAEITTELDRLRVVEQQPGTEAGPGLKAALDGALHERLSQLRTEGNIGTAAFYRVSQIIQEVLAAALPPESPEHQPDDEATVHRDDAACTCSLYEGGDPACYYHGTRIKGFQAGVAAVVELLRGAGYVEAANWAESHPRFKDGTGGRGA